MKYCGLNEGDKVYCKKNILSVVVGDELTVLWADFGRIKLSRNETEYELDSYIEFREHFAFDKKIIRKMKLERLRK